MGSGSLSNRNGAEGIGSAFLHLSLRESPATLRARPFPFYDLGHERSLTCACTTASSSLSLHR